MAFFDPTRPAYLANPYPALTRLRCEDPVHWSAGLNAWVATRFAECAEVLRDGRRFTVDPARTAGPRAAAIAAHRAMAPLGNVPNLGTSSGAAHRDLRRRVNPIFTPAAVRAAAPMIHELATCLVEAIPPGEPFDFMAALANPLPRQVMARAMGLPAADADSLQRDLVTIEVTRANARAGPAMVARAEAARASVAATFAPHAGRGLPGTTVFGALTAASEHGDTLDADPLISVAAHIATVGADPTSGALANAVAALAANPAVIDALRRSPNRMAAAVHEFLRYDSPTHIVARFAAEETRLGARRIRRGDAVLAVVGAANRDPAMFPEPDTLDITRDARRELSFGQGEHICLGAPLALAIVAITLELLMARFARIELAAEPAYGGSVELRVPDRLMLRCVQRESGP